MMSSSEGSRLQELLSDQATCERDKSLPSILISDCDSAVADTASNLQGARCGCITRSCQKDSDVEKSAKR